MRITAHRMHPLRTCRSSWTHSSARQTRTGPSTSTSRCVLLSIPFIYLTQVSPLIKISISMKSGRTNNSVVLRAGGDFSTQTARSRTSLFRIALHKGPSYDAPYPFKNSSAPLINDDVKCITPPPTPGQPKYIIRPLASRILVPYTAF